VIVNALDSSTISRSWHALDPKEALDLLAADAESGLSRAEATRRLGQVGPNRVADHGDASLWELLRRQFRSIVVLLLLAAAGIALFVGEWLESGAILVALLLNAAIGFGTEWRAQRSLAALRSLAVPRAIVRRDGQVSQVPAAELVPGDLLLLEPGIHVPADCRLVQSAALQTSEAALTGRACRWTRTRGPRSGRTPQSPSGSRWCTWGPPSSPAAPSAW